MPPPAVPGIAFGLASTLAPLAIAGPIGLAAGVALGLAGRAFMGRPPKKGTKDYEQLGHKAGKAAIDDVLGKIGDQLHKAYKRGEISYDQMQEGLKARARYGCVLKLNEYDRYRDALGVLHAKKEARGLGRSTPPRAGTLAPPAHIEPGRDAEAAGMTIGELAPVALLPRALARANMNGGRSLSEIVLTSAPALPPDQRPIPSLSDDVRSVGIAEMGGRPNRLRRQLRRQERQLRRRARRGSLAIA
jgi:hypothetical protein